MKKLLLVAALLGVVGATFTLAFAASKGDKNVEETECTVVRKWKHGETRVVFVVRCVGSEDFGIADVDEKVYRKGGAMLMQLDNEESK